MKISIHISHGEADDLAQIQAAAGLLGLTVNTRGGFMGKHYTEICGEMAPAALAQMMEDAAEGAAVAA